MHPPASRRRPLRLAGRLALTTALGTLVLGYGRRAYAGSCNPVSSVFLCTGPADVATDLAQVISGAPLAVRTAPGFGLDTSGSPATAMDLTGTGGLSFDGSAPGLAIRAEGTGVQAYNTGGGTLSVDTRGGAVTAGDITSYPPTAFTGIRARNDTGGTGMTIRTGDISATDLAILSRNAGGGAFVIDTTGGDVTANGLAISAANDGTDLLITTGNVRSLTTGAITAVNDGTGLTRIDTTAGLVSGRGGVSVYARTKGTDLDIRTADVVAGIRALNNGTGAVTVDTTGGQVESLGASGIYVLSAASGASVSVRSADVSGVRGVRVINNGTGPTSIDTTAGNAIGDNAAIRVQQTATAGAVSVTAGYVRGGQAGIYVTSDSDAPTLIDGRAGRVIGIGITGILAMARNVTIRSAEVYGGIEGIAVINNGGTLTVDSTRGAVTGNGQSGINLLNYGTDVSLVAGAVTGATSGISITNQGTGSVTIDSTAGLVTGNGGDGINVESNGTDVSVVTGSVTSASVGIRVNNHGSGVMNIDSTGGVVPGGIVASNYGTALAIAAARSGNITAYNRGSGDLTISASSGPLGDADLRSSVYAYNAGRNTSVVLTGSFTTAYAKHLGTGDATVDTSAAAMISGPAVSAVGLYASAGDAQIITSDVEFNGLSSSTTAVMLNNQGTGHSRIDTRGGTVSAYGLTPDDNWSKGVAGSSRNGLAIYTGAVTSDFTAVTAVNFESGELVVDTTGGAITSIMAIGIEATANGSSGALRIAARDVSAGGAAISATQEGAGGLSIVDHGGRVTGTIVAENKGAGAALIDTRGATLVSSASAIIANSSGSSLSISTSDVDAQTLAISARNFGPGDLVVDTSAGSVRSAFDRGIDALSTGNDLTIMPGDVTGATIGIFANNTGSGDLTIDGNGTLAGAYAALWLENRGAGLNVELAGKVDGRLFLRQAGTGDAQVDLSRAAVTSAQIGLHLVAESGDIDLKTGAVLSTDPDALSAAVAVLQTGSGALIADARAGALESRNGLGLYALSEGAGDISIQAGVIESNRQGIAALNRGGGSISIDATGGSVTSAATDAIYAFNTSDGADVSIRAGGAVAAGSGSAILAHNSGTGSTAVDVVDGAVAEGSFAAVNLYHAGSGTFSLENAGTLRNAAGDPAALAVKAEVTGSGTGFSLRNTGTITGTLQLTAKDDGFVNDGTWNMAGGTSDFGAGFDRFENRSNLTFVAASDPARAETTTLTNLEAFRNSGTIRMADGGVGDVLTTSGDFDGAGGTIRLDMMADGSAADLFAILGSVTGGPSLVRINYLGTGGALGVGGVPLIEVAGNTKEGDFRIANPVWDGLVYKMVLGPGSQWGATPVYSLAATLAALSRDADAAAVLLDGQQAGLVNALAQDCTHFGASGACVSLGGRSTSLNKGQGSSDALVLTAAVRPTGSDWRMGAFLDQRVAGELPDGLSFETMGPTLGGFAGYGTADGLGPRLRLSGAWSTARLGIKRESLAEVIEGGEAEAGLSGWGFGGEAGYGLALTGSATLTPFMGLRRVVSTRGTYTEEGGDADYPLSANAMSLAQTTLSTGATLDAELGDALSVQAGVGVEHDLSYSLDSLDGNFPEVGSFSSPVDQSWRSTRLFGGAGVDYEMADGLGLSVSAAIRQLPLDAAFDVTSTLALRAAF